MYVKCVTKLGILIILDKPNQGKMGHGYLTIYIICIMYLLFMYLQVTITFI